MHSTFSLTHDVAYYKAAKVHLQSSEEKEEHRKVFSWIKYDDLPHFALHAVYHHCTTAIKPTESQIRLGIY